MNKPALLLVVVSLFLLDASPIAKVEPNGGEAIRDRGIGHVAVESDSCGATNQPINQLTNPPPAAIFGIKTVVIDAGHGGKDPGCLGKTLKEKDVALAIALKLGKYIETKTPDVKVIYTRSTDVFLELDERAAIANKYKADLFICLHCNTACSQDRKTKKITCNEDIVGTETYVMGLHKTQANLNVAKRENEAILLEKNYHKRYDGFDPNSETGYILLTMQQNAYFKQSLSFASKVQKNVKEKAGRFDKGVQQAGFLVLWRTAMPSVLIETEFLSSTASEKFVGSEKGVDYMARSIFSAFRQYKDEVEGKLVKYEDDVEEGPKFVPEKDTVGSRQSAVGSQQPIQEKESGKKDSARADSKQLTVDNKQPEKADSIKTRKDPIVQFDDKIGTVPKDTAPKVQMLPPVKKDTVAAIKTNPVVESSSPVVYKVQFMSASQRVPLLSDKFKGLKEVGEYQDGTAYKYTSGEFKTLDEALKHRAEMQGKGFKDCFVVKFRDGKRLKN